MSLYIVRFEGDHEVEADNEITAKHIVRKLTSGLGHVDITECQKVD